MKKFCKALNETVCAKHLLNLQKYLPVTVIILLHIFNIGTVVIIDVYLDLFKVFNIFAYHPFLYLRFSFWDYFFFLNYVV